MQQITDRAKEDKIPALWRLAFRPGFLLSAIFAVLSIVLWIYWLETGNSVIGLEAQKAFSPQWWHGHEMLFGFGLPVVIGFLLTAVQTWTNIPGTRHYRLMAIFGCWLFARVVLIIPADLQIPNNLILAMVADTLFIALGIYELFIRVWARKQWHNLAFIPILLVFAGLNITSYVQADSNGSGVFGRHTNFHYSAMMLYALLLTVMGGRVIPFFTARRLNLQQADKLKWLEISCIALTVIAVILTANGLLAGDFLKEGSQTVQALLLITAGIHLTRQARWHSLKTGGVPLLWSLHLSYLCIPVTLALLAFNLDNPIAIKNLMHLLGIGAIGGMIIAMMARVSLGHTGRSLDIKTDVVFALALVLIAGLIRSLLPTIYPELTLWAFRLSALCWVVGFVLFLKTYAPMYLKARVDGRPG